MLLEPRHGNSFADLMRSVGDFVADVFPVRAVDKIGQAIVSGLPV